MEKYHITADNLYNWDEKGFMIGFARTLKRVVTLEALKSGRIRGAAHDGNREFITLLACICADGSKLPPGLIYQGESGMLQDTWVEDFKVGDEAFFTTTPTGWTSDSLGVDWLKRVFDRYTKEKGRGRRLLILDGHSSHFNWKFLITADALRILLLILPLYSTHRLQPLDVGLFSPLSTAYSNELNDLLTGSLGYTLMSKCLFWRLFKPAWETAFSEKNILSSFEKTGIFPYNPDLVLDVIQIPPQSPKSQDEPKTPLTSRSIRRAQKVYKLDPSKKNLDLLFKSQVKLAAQYEIALHERTGLVDALQIEKGRVKRGKRLNVLGEEENGDPHFISPSKINAAKVYQAEKEAQEDTEQKEKAARKDEMAAKRAQKQAEKEERALQRVARRDEARQAKAEKAAQIQARKEAREQAKAAKEAKKEVRKAAKASKASKVPKASEKLVSEVVENVAEARSVLEEPKLVNSRGRAISKPLRYKN